MDVKTANVECIRLSEREGVAMDIFSHENHALYIKNIDMLQSKYQCSKCEMVFVSSAKLRNHSKNQCELVNIESFPAEPTIYRPAPNTIRSMLTKYSIQNADQYIDHFIVYDVEAILKTIATQHGENTVFTNEHIPVSVSVADSLTEEYNVDKYKSLLQKIINAHGLAGMEIPGVVLGKTYKISDVDGWIKVGKYACFFDFRSILGLKDLFAVIGTDNIKSAIKYPSNMCIATSNMKMLDISNYVPGVDTRVRMQRQSGSFGVTLDHLSILLQKQKYLCGLCYCQLTTDTASADRINNKLGHIDGNILISCVKCNTARKDMSPKGFRNKKLLDFNADRLVYSIDKEEKDIYGKMKANIAGGSSIIFNRYVKRNKTKICGGKLYKKVIGYDANALYLWALGNDMPCGRLTTYPEIVEDIKNDKIFGFLECDIHTPEHLKQYFGEMTPIFKNTLIDCTDESIIGKHMYDYNQARKKSKSKPARKLIGSYFGEKRRPQVSTSRHSFHALPPQQPFVPLRGTWLHRRGARECIHVPSAIILSTRLYSIGIYLMVWKSPIHTALLKASSHKAFAPFMEAVSNARREGDADESKAMIAEMMKLVGNSALGRSGMDMSKHKEIKNESSDKAIKAKIKHFTFHGLEELNDACELTMMKRKLKNKNPIHLSIAIYQLAKLRMLQFYYDCIDFYLDRSDFQYQEMDTDSAYIAFSCDNPFQDCIKPELREHFDEWSGDAMVSLSSRNYICYLPDGSYKVKVSANGVQQGRGRNAMFLVLRGLRLLCGIVSHSKALTRGLDCGKRLNLLSHTVRQRQRYHYLTGDFFCLIKHSIMKQLLSKLYYDPKTGYINAQALHEKARELDPKITLTWISGLVMNLIPGSHNIISD
ncbi:unnamed protein product [Phytophthora lilii]|uniref:Unnamed protein product n=1 Tax=Phytophthora lilii TaxID=2077276 RepID=A0A9W6X4V5_9STRA|nr:unnamed protein product [Phytophthora lilii]